jgi:hypothetical protein
MATTQRNLGSIQSIYTRTCGWGSCPEPLGKKDLQACQPIVAVPLRKSCPPQIIVKIEVHTTAVTQSSRSAYCNAAYVVCVPARCAAHFPVCIDFQKNRLCHPSKVLTVWLNALAS